MRKTHRFSLKISALNVIVAIIVAICWLPQFNQNRNVSLWFPQFDLKVAVKRFRATLNCELCILASHRLQPESQTLMQAEGRVYVSPEYTIEGQSSTFTQIRI